MKKTIRPIYTELKGLLSQAPEKHDDVIFEESVWQHFNDLVDELNTVTGESYERFKIVPVDFHTSPGVRVLDYRTKVSGLISRLYGQFFSDETDPYTNTPHTVITQNQTQSLHVQILLDIQSLIDKRIDEFKQGSKERTFLEKIKSSLSTVSNVVELIKLILTIGKELNLPAGEILNILS